MRTVTALDVRKRFGEIVDQAAAGERIVIERAGQPIAAIVPLSDLAELDPERREASRLAAIGDIRRMPRLSGNSKVNSAELVRQSRQARDAQILRARGR